MIVLFRLLDRRFRCLDILLCRTQIQICRAHIKADLLVRCREGFLRLAERRLCRIDLRRRHTVIEDVPRGTDAYCPCIATRVVTPKRMLARNRARRRRIHGRMIARLCRTHALLRLLYGIDRRRTIRAVEEPIVRTVIERELVARIAQLIVDREHRIRRHADHIVQRCHCDLIVVPRRRQILLCVRKLHLRGEHIRTRHRTNAELCVHIRKMSLQRRHRILAYLHQIACLQNIEIVHRRRQADRLLCLLERKVRRIQSIARRLPPCIQRSIIDGHRDRARIAVVVLDAGPLICLAANAVRRCRPRQRRSHRTVCLRE